MVNGLFRLGHHPVIGSDHQHHDVRYLRTTGAHGGKGFVAGGVQEGNLPAIFQFHFVRTNMLGNPTGFPGYHIGIADVVQQGRFPVVHVSHDGNYRRAGLQIFGIIFLFRNFFNDFRSKLLFLFYLVTELFGQQLNGVQIQTLIDGNN